jgi:hypothetical protein
MESIIRKYNEPVETQCFHRYNVNYTDSNERKLVTCTTIISKSHIKSTGRFSLATQKYYSIILEFRTKISKHDADRFVELTHCIVIESS